MVETKNNDGIHFCTTEIYVPQEYFRLCYICRQLMFCCDLEVDDDVKDDIWRHENLNSLFSPAPLLEQGVPNRMAFISVQVRSFGFYLDGFQYPTRKFCWFSSFHDVICHLWRHHQLQDHSKTSADDGCRTSESTPEVRKFL